MEQRRRGRKATGQILDNLQSGVVDFVLLDFFGCFLVDNSVSSNLGLDLVDNSGDLCV